MMKGVPYLFTVAILALATTLVSAYDPSPLQDFCVAINNTDSADISSYALLPSLTQARIRRVLVIPQDRDSITSNMMKGVPYLFTVAILALATTLVSAYDPSPLQDFCVAINNTDSAVFVNGKFCKDPATVTANDFFFPGLNIPGNTAASKLGSSVNLVNVDKLPGLNTLGISLARLDFAPYGLNPPHTHPRGTELLVVMEGTLLVGFVTSNPNKLFTKVLNKGDVFVFPIGLIHFQFNIGQSNAVAFAGLSSQNPGLITIANAVFGSNPPINPNVLAKAFQLDKNVVDYLQKQF
nr:germin-like protein subfamily 1 member 7 [Quercus suber]